jgi:hypothetical protein
MNTRSNAISGLILATASTVLPHLDAQTFQPPGQQAAELSPFVVNSGTEPGAPCVQRAFREKPPSLALSGRLGF